MRALALDLVALERLHRHLQVLGGELVVLAVDVDRDVAAVAQRRGGVGGVEAGDRGRDQRHVLAEARTERAVVRLELDLAELVGLGDEPELPDVELLADDLGHALDRLALGAGGDDDRGAQRPAHLELCLTAGREPEPDGLARDRHRAARASRSRASGVGKSHRWTLGSEPSRLS